MDTDSDDGGLDGYDAAGGYDETGGYDALGGYREAGGYDGPDELGTQTDHDAYWRRRFIILGGGIAALVLCAWFFPGSRAPARTSATARASMASLAGHDALPAAAYGSAWPGPAAKRPATAGPSPRPSSTASPGQTAGARRLKGQSAGTSYHPGHGPAPSPSATALAGAAGGSRCAPAGIVLSLFTSQDSYAQRALPTFSVYAVSTSATACTLAYGPGSVQVIVTRRGRVVWDSAACKPPAARPVRFTLGVPQVLTMPWNRQAAGPSGCGGSLAAGTWGTFDAVAMTDGQSSPVRSFKLDK